MASDLRSPAIKNFKAGTIELSRGVESIPSDRVGDIAVATGDLILNTTVMLAEVKKIDIIRSIMLFNSVALDSSTGLTVDVGLFKYDFRTDSFSAALNSSAASLAACFASAITTFQSANSAVGVEVSNLAGNVGIAGKMTVRVEDLLGDLNISDSNEPLFVGLTFHHAATTAVAGSIGFKVSTIR